MKPKHFPKLNKTGIKTTIQDVAPSRKSKSIGVSPLESKVNTGCMNSPKNSSSPLKNKANINNYISRYVTRALAQPDPTSNKKSMKFSYTHRRTNSDEQTDYANIKKNKYFKDKYSSSIAGYDEKTMKKDFESLTTDIEKTVCRESSRKKIYNTNDMDEDIREKLIENVIASFNSVGSAPNTSVEFYKLGKQIGRGAFGKVYIAVNRLTGFNVAIKTIEKAYIKDERTRRKIFQEVFFMKKLRHRNIIRLLEVFESNKSIMIVSEYAGGGDLLQVIKTRGRLNEHECKSIFFQIIDAVKACHIMGIIHRDIKLDNILLNSDYSEIKLCDFGVSRFAKAGEKIYEQCGTPAYLAPEIIVDQGYEPFFVDIWSMGILLYAMLSATVPFKAKNIQDLNKIILKCKYDVPEYFSPEVVDFISKMLNPIPHMRIKLDEMKAHPWLKGFIGQKRMETSISVAKQNDILKKMGAFGFPREYVIQSLNLKDVNHASAIYNLFDLESY